MAEGARLESVYAGNRIEGSNPSPSANLLWSPLVSIGYIFTPHCPKPLSHKLLHGRAPCFAYVVAVGTTSSFEFHAI